MDDRIQWVRQKLIERREVEKVSYGIWGITEKGATRLKTEEAAGNANLSRAHKATVLPASHIPVGDLEEIAEGYVTTFKQNVLAKLLELSPSQFEQFAGTLLKGYGFQKILITGKAGDGGIDGHGQLRVGLAVVKAAFQCKRWQRSVGPKEVQAFRGAISGQFEQGYFFTTSTFTKAAQAESIKIGTVPVILFEGEQIVDIMIEKSVGIRRRPIEVYEDQLEQLFET